MTSPFSVIAIIATHNEEDIIDACLEHLHHQRVTTYLLDDGSTDETVARAKRHLGRGLQAIEDIASTDRSTFTLDRILARKETLASVLDFSWIINQDADEFRESLWAELDLTAAIERVDQLGWNAIDFEIFTIRPVGPRNEAHASPADDAGWFSPAADCDRLQVRAWKRLPCAIDLRRSGGHDVQFPDRRVFPLRFPMRHYPIRSQRHGERKLFTDRIPRFNSTERERGWHVQYEAVARGDTLVARTEEVFPYDATNARIVSALRNRDLEALQAAHAGTESELAIARDEVVTLQSDVAGLRAELQALRNRVQMLQAAIDSAEEMKRGYTGLSIELSSTASELSLLKTAYLKTVDERDRLIRDTGHLLTDLHRLHQSWSWRVTGPLRVVWRWLRGQS